MMARSDGLKMKHMDDSSLIEGWLAKEGVNHVGISGPVEFRGSDLPEGMTVFWWKDRPVGHCMVKSGGRSPTHARIEADVLDRIAAEEQARQGPVLSASVVICTRDRPEALQRCLASLPQQTYPPREIIVVDNASRDQGTRAVVLAAGASYVREDRPGLDIARNSGARRANSEIVAYTDDDVILHRHWLERLVTAFDSPQIAAVTGLVLPAELTTEAQVHFETYWSFGQGYHRQDFDATRFAAHADGVFPAWKVGAGASMAFRREVFDRVGYFDERLDVGQAGCSGDSEFWYRLLAKGGSCRYEPSSVAFHFHRRTMEGLSRQIFHYMRGHAAALLVQYERTGIAMNRTQALRRMPGWYASRLWARLFGRESPQDRFLREEILGYLSGLLFYYRNRGRSHDLR
jgi:glycosyltransferase involved in cell wall biosynthesis